MGRGGDGERGACPPYPHKYFISIPGILILRSESEIILLLKNSERTTRDDGDKKLFTFSVAPASFLFYNQT